MISLFALVSNAAPDETSTSTQWTYVGKVQACTGIQKNYKSVHQDCTMCVLYSNFDGENMIYKLYVPSDGRAYKAHHVGSGGRYVEYDRHDRVKYVPSLSEMYTHCAAGYYFNPTDARK